MHDQQPPAVVNITSEPADPEPAPGLGSDRVPTPDVAPAGSGSTPTPPPSEGRDPGIKRPPRPSAPSRDPYNVALRGNIASMRQCATTHGAPVANMLIKMKVSTSGRTKTVQFEPAAINGTPLGACIKNVLSGIVFPAATDEKTLSFPVNTRG